MIIFVCYVCCSNAFTHYCGAKVQKKIDICKKKLFFLFIGKSLKIRHKKSAPKDASTCSVGTLHGSLALIGLLSCFTPLPFSAFITNWFIVVYKHVIGLNTYASQSNLGGNTDSKKCRIGAKSLHMSKKSSNFAAQNCVIPNNQTP